MDYPLDYVEFLTSLKTSALMTGKEQNYNNQHFWIVHAKALRSCETVTLSGFHNIGKEFEVISFSTYNNIEGWTPCAFGGNKVLAFNPRTSTWVLYASEERDGQLWP